ncbi:hypothetical protein [Roseiterribacter gracilis]|uniref:Uncharacterized protein n=1 Tax=Roseiterribacter gracilis TaxID=2812848 RepID=A0A8S8XD22_9PROT|nr:hypothetical protein TMPK1_14040 [Rhodospirillales bacterium TMPK1]
MRILLLAAALLLPVAASAGDTMVGGPSTWTWNAKESTLPPGSPAPKSQVMNVTKDDGTTVDWTITAVTADGQTTSKSWSGPFDGKLRPVQGRDGVSVGFGPAGKNAYLVKWEMTNGATGTETCTRSNGGKKITCKCSAKLPDGKTIDYVDVLDRN